MAGNNTDDYCTFIQQCLGLKATFPPIFREKIGTALAGPQGERQGWQRIKTAGTTIFLVGFTGNVFIQVTHKLADIV